MEKNEFEARTGFTVTDEEYKEIEIMYCDAENMDKDDFCKDYKKHKDSSLLSTYYKKSAKLYDELSELKDERSRMVDFILVRAQAFGDLTLLEKAINMVGHANVIKRKIAHEYPLWVIDKNYIKDNIK